MRTLTDDHKKVLDDAAKYYGLLWNADQIEIHNGKEKFDRAWVSVQLYNFTFKDEFDHIVAGMKQYMSPSALTMFEELLTTLPPRSNEVFAQLLAEKQPVQYVAPPTDPKEA